MDGVFLFCFFGGWVDGFLTSVRCGTLLSVLLIFIQRCGFPSHSLGVTGFLSVVHKKKNSDF